MRTYFTIGILIAIFFNSCNQQRSEIGLSKKNRNQQWSEDIAFFENVYLSQSKTFSKDSIASCKTLMTSLKTRIDSLSNNQIILELSKCVAMANNGHTTIHLSGMDKVPLRFHRFSDGLHIIKSDKASSKYLGAKVLEINSLDVDVLQEKLDPYLSGIESWKKYTASNYLSSPEILHGIGVGEKDSLTLELLQNGDTLNISLGVKKMKNSTYEYETWSDLYPEDKDTIWTHVKKGGEQLPLYLKYMRKGVHYEFLDAHKVAYFSINALWYECPDFEGQIDEFLDSLEEKPDYDVIIDLRYYTGGNFLIPTELATKPPKMIDDDNEIYLITSNMTFSAGLITAARVKYFAENKIVIVGEEVGDNLKFWAEGVYYELPHSGIEVQDSEYEHDWKNDEFKPGRTFWVNAFYGVAAKDLKVDKEIIPSYADYLANRDPIVEWILQAKN